ncbi:MAG: HAD family hydrolase [Candidatus Binatus sp.]|uniref:HAD family hydrolase n=1 Tax=Candidatus Binatus sp. TaxID=2811406 RepID=UPI003C74AE38
MAAEHVVFLFDVDNTLIDNDHIVADMKRNLERDIGNEQQQRYWDYFEELRTELGYADYLGALQRYRVNHPRDFGIIAVSYFLMNYYFANRLFPCALDVIAQYQQYGETAILSDGDMIFQPLKIERSGLREAVDEKVMIYIHKEQELDDVKKRYPADHYVLIDDKVRILDAVKKTWGANVTTVFPRQGHYAADAKEVAKYMTPDVTVDRIDQLREYDLARLRAATKG